MLDSFSKSNTNYRADIFYSDDFDEFWKRPIYWKGTFIKWDDDDVHSDFKSRKKNVKEHK